MACTHEREHHNNRVLLFQPERVSFTPTTTRGLTIPMRTRGAGERLVDQVRVPAGAQCGDDQLQLLRGGLGHDSGDHGAVRARGQPGVAHHAVQGPHRHPGAQAHAHQQRHPHVHVTGKQLCAIIAPVLRCRFARVWFPIPDRGTQAVLTDDAFSPGALQYKLLFATTRIPGEECDELINFKGRESRHIAVLANGSWFTVDMYNNAGDLLEPHDLETQFERVLEHSKTLKPTQTEVCPITSFALRASCVEPLGPHSHAFPSLPWIGGV